MEHLPFYISLVMGLSTFFCVYLFARAASKYTTRILVGATIWLVVNATLAARGFYADTTAMPPRFLLAVLPPLLLIVALFVTRKGQYFMDGLDIKSLTLLHVVRIPVELVLYWLYIYGKVPEIMTFEGQNFDVFSGITAIAVYFLFVKERVGTGILMMWNFLCLVLLINIVATAVLSAPFPFQQFGFEQPNVAVLHFPYVWLPSCIVPIVLFSHLAALRKLMNDE